MRGGGGGGGGGNPDKGWSTNKLFPEGGALSSWGIAAMDSCTGTFDMLGLPFLPVPVLSGEFILTGFDISFNKRQRLVLDQR